MQLALVMAISLHILSATFWAGTTFAATRMERESSEGLFYPQLVAAAFSVGTGAYLWRTMHGGSFATQEKMLTAGAAAAILALVIQATIIGSALRQVRRPGCDKSRVQSRIAVAQRTSAFLLALAAVGMAASRYA